MLIHRKQANKIQRVGAAVTAEEERIVAKKRKWVDQQMEACEQAFYGTIHWMVWDGALREVFERQFVDLAQRDPSLGPMLDGVKI